MYTFPVGSQLRSRDGKSVAQIAGRSSKTDFGLSMLNQNGRGSIRYHLNHLRDRRSYIWAYAEKKSQHEKLSGMREGIWRSPCQLQDQNGELWHGMKTRRWKEHAHLKEALLQTSIPKGEEAQHEDLMDVLPFGNKDLFSAQGKLWTCNLEAQLVSKCLHKKHNNNCFKERCSNLHETLSSR